MAERNQQVQLSDGRRLGYDSYGTRQGKPLFYFHGGPSSRKEWQLFGDEALAKRLGLWIIAPDRPGMGLSDFQQGRRISDWPLDVAELADALGLQRFAVLGYSAGGPYAAACARHIPTRLTRVGLVSGLGPFDVPGLTDAFTPFTLRNLYMSRDHPWFSRLSLRLVGLMLPYAPRRLLRQAAAFLPERDQRVLSNKQAQQTLVAMIREALRQGPRGPQWEGGLMVSHWGFDPARITAEVHLWHGEADQNVPVAMGRYLAQTIPGCHAQFYPDDGHLSLLHDHAEDILRTLA